MTSNDFREHTRASAFIGVDVGGTFTDLVTVSESGHITALKVPSTPADQSEGVSEALRSLRDIEVARFVHGTTVATNMLLERAGARVALVATEGFTDILQLARQDRASLYDLSRHHPAPLVSRENIIGARERIAPEGVLVSLDEQELARIVNEVRERDVAVVVVALLHSYADPSHERCIRDAISNALPLLDVIISSDVFPEIREYERTSTAVAEGYLRPGVARYLTHLSARAEEAGVPAPGVMTSGGGMRTAKEAAGNAASLALSGPAGGIVGAAAVFRATGFRHALTVDIGGTSADVGLILDGEPFVEPGGRVAGVPIALPRVLIETVSAGGGSIGWMDDGGALRVGPHSAGAVPGPAAFGRGGSQPTVTDAHVVLGNISAGMLSGGIVLDQAEATRAVDSLATRISESRERVARAMIDIANASVARALRRMSVERGVNPRDCVLVPFGGGGPLHACGLAELLDITTIYVPPHAGVLSALGLAITAERREQQTSVLRDTATLEIDDITQLLARSECPNTDGASTHAHFARARYVGQGHELDVPVLHGDDGAAIMLRFAEVHRKRNGFTLDARVEIVGMRYVASSNPHHVRFSRAAGSTWRDDTAIDDGGTFAARVEGPRIVMLPGATLHIAKGWTGEPHPTGGWVLKR